MKHELTKTSARRLASAHPKLQEVVNAASARFDINVIEGHRSKRRQKQLFLAGRSMLDGESELSMHNHSPSLSVDIAPKPIDWQDLDRFRRFGEYVLGVAEGMGIKLRWGGDWDGDADLTDQTFDDLVHFELVDYDRDSSISVGKQDPA